MLVKTTPAWFLPEHKATPEKIFWNRRDFSKRAAAGTLLGATGINLGKKLCVSTGYAAEGPLSSLFPAPTTELGNKAIEQSDYVQFGTDRQKTL